MDANLRDWPSFEDFIGERDGAFRDINFAAPTWKGVSSLLEHFNETYQLKTASDQKGPVDEVLSIVVETKARQPGGLFVSFKSGVGWISEFQVFFGIEDDSSPFVEISFHPDDVVHVGDMRSKFLTWTDEIRLLLEAVSYSYG